MLKTTKKRIDNAETSLEFTDKIVIPTPEVEEFIYELEKLISNFAV